MDHPLLNDKNEYPANDVLQRCLGKTKAVWEAFVSQISTVFSPMSMEWRFYNDGKAWLCKLVYKKKTVCWISVWPGYFKTTFYFMDKNKKDIRGLNIDERWKTRYLSDRSAGTLKPLTVEVKTKKALSSVFELIQYKSQWRPSP